MVALRFLFIFGIFGISVLCQKKDKVINLHHADSLVGLEIAGEPVRELIGNVKFSQDNVVVTCQKAMQYLRSNKVWLEGEVEVIDKDVRMVGSRGMYYGDSKIAEVFERVMLEDGTTTLRANYGKYFLEEKKAYFATNVSVEDSTSVLTADEFTYFREEQRSIAQGNVRIVDSRNSVTLFGNHFVHYRKDRYSKMTQQAKAVQIDTTTEGIY
ncbi:MAG TPA: OstA-like protein, partial [Bacteroidota bacterium]|nr:OstA-like protein [Bacteroidota bacterium]